MNIRVLTILHFGHDRHRISVGHLQLGLNMNTAEIIQAAEIGTITVIDLRDLAEVQSSGMAAGALHIPLSLLPQKVNPNSTEFDPRIASDRPVAVYSAAGGRSAKGAEILKGFGYRVENIGGFYDWAVAGGAITR